MNIPIDYPVQPLDEDENPIGRTTCGHCGLSWDDDKPTSLTPTPGGRCPFEYFHEDEDDAIKPSTDRKDRIDRSSDLRLRILDYHLSVIIRLDAGGSGSTLHTVKGFDCTVFRHADGDYWIGAARCTSLGNAISEFLRQLNEVATGLHSDND